VKAAKGKESNLKGPLQGVGLNHTVNLIFVQDFSNVLCCSKIRKYEDL
jgi:hypothetical protein